jgi:hypothetical protein
MKPTLRSNYDPSACQSLGGADSFSQYYGAEYLLVCGRKDHVAEAHQPVRVGNASQPRDSARMVLSTTEELGVKKRESPTWILFFLARKKNTLYNRRGEL